MALDKRRDTDQPLNEHDVAERLTKAAVRLYRILVELRELGMAEAVQHSRYYHEEMLAAVADELATGWQVEPKPLKPSAASPQ